MDAQAANVSGLPVVARHLITARIEPNNFRRRFAMKGFAVEEAAAMERGLFAVNGDEPSDEFQEIFLAIVELPIQPRDFVILAVRVVVSPLRVTDFITRKEHGDAL